MVDPALYNNLSIETACGNSDGIPQFDITQLLQLRTIDSDSEYVKQSAGKGGSTMRNHHLHRLYTVKPEFKQLKIVEFILKNLPFKRITSIHCVSMESGSFACIHRDLRYEFGHESPFAENLGANNGVYQQGSVLMVLNLSDGGVPLWWSLDGDDSKKVLKSNDLVYLSSDYFLHGVPVCTSRRRQIRVTGVPSSKLYDLVDHSSKIVLPDDYKFDEEKDWDDEVSTYREPTQLLVWKKEIINRFKGLLITRADQERANAMNSRAYRNKVIRRVPAINLTSQLQDKNITIYFEDEDERSESFGSLAHVNTTRCLVNLQNRIYHRKQLQKDHWASLCH